MPLSQEKVTNVNVYPYIHWNPILGVGPEIPPVLKGAQGTYSVDLGPLGGEYRLDLQGGELRKGEKFHIHQLYTALGSNEDGGFFSTPEPLYCIEGGGTPKFVRLIFNTFDSTEVTVNPSNNSGILKLLPLSNVNVSQEFPPPIIGIRPLIEGGEGFLLATKIGTPHLMGVEVTGGKRFGKLEVGMKNIFFSGRSECGEKQELVYGHLTCTAAGEPGDPNKPAVFFQTFPD